MYWFRQTLIIPQLFLAIFGIMFTVLATLITAFAALIKVLADHYIEMSYVIDDIRNDNNVRQ